MKISRFTNISCCLLTLISFSALHAQMITGTWQGRVNKQKAELKIIQNGDSLTGTAYYFDSPTKFRRYSIKGYRNPNDNSVVWWDDQLIEDNNKGLKGKLSALAVADFNCPGGDVMTLDGNTYDKNEKQTGDVKLDKVTTSVFKDEWDFIIDNYTSGGNDPDLIDSVSMIAFTKTIDEPVETVTNPEPKRVSQTVTRPEPPVKKQVLIPRQEIKTPEKKTPATIEQKFITREKVFTKEIELRGDSVELRFYDNAEIDGDSISLFLNGKLMFEHIRLTEKAYTLKLAVSDLNELNELIMVAENLGAIPPNTSFMIAIVDDKRYEAQLASTENSSAMIRFVKR